MSKHITLTLQKSIILVPNTRSVVTASLFHFGILMFPRLPSFLLCWVALCRLCERSTIK